MVHRAALFFGSRVQGGEQPLDHNLRHLNYRPIEGTTTPVGNMCWP